MSDPRNTDPRYNDPRVHDPLQDPINPRAVEPGLRAERNAGGMWGWVIGFAVLALVAFVVVAGMNSSTDTASNMAPPPLSTENPSPGATAPTTTGSGATSPRMDTTPPAAQPAPTTPPPAAPAPRAQ